jgi:hypothetical protein
MKKIATTLAVLLITLVVSAQTVQNTYVDYNGNIIVNYKNDVDEQKTFNIPENTLNGNDSIILSAFKQILKNRIDTITKTKKEVDYVDYRYDAFSISILPINGKTFKQLTKFYSELSNADKAVIDGLKAKVYDVKGVTVTSFYTKFGSNKISINGIEYPYSDFISIEFANAIKLANKLINE